MIQSNSSQQINYYYFPPTNTNTNIDTNANMIFPNIISNEVLGAEFPNPQASWCQLSNNSSTSDEADGSILDERKQRRMISNRESARRSRMRKQRHLDELWSQVLRLRTLNHSLIQKMNQISQSHHRLLQENVKLREQAAHLQHLYMISCNCNTTTTTTQSSN